MKLPNTPTGIELGMSEAQVAEILNHSGYGVKPKVLTMTNPDVAESDCGKGNPTLINSYIRYDEFKDQKVEYVFGTFFNDNNQDGKCEPTLKWFNAVEVREPSYMKEIK